MLERAMFWVERQTSLCPLRAAGQLPTVVRLIELTPLVVTPPYEHPETLWDEALVATGHERAIDIITRAQRLTKTGGIVWVTGDRCGDEVDWALTDEDGTVYAVTTQEVEPCAVAS